MTKQTKLSYLDIIELSEKSLSSSEDAFELAVKLEMRITNEVGKTILAESYFDNDYYYSVQVVSDTQNACCATRKAISEVAVKIAKDMK